MVKVHFVGALQIHQSLMPCFQFPIFKQHLIFLNC